MTTPSNAGLIGIPFVSRVPPAPPWIDGQMSANFGSNSRRSRMRRLILIFARRRVIADRTALMIANKTEIRIGGRPNEVPLPILIYRP
jgi:hypothetical protein